MPAVIANTLFGPMIVPPFDEYLSKALIRMGQYAPAEFQTWAPYIPVGGVVVDAGANIGAHTMAFGAVVGPTGTVFAVEPQRMLYYMLCGSLALGNGEHVHAKHCALAQEMGTARIPLHMDYSAPNNFGALSLREIPPEIPCELVPAVPLDSWDLQRLDFLKIDVEGAELGVLHGGKETIARCRPVMSVEADREQNVPATLAWLRLNGYRAWWHRPELGPLWPRVVSINLLALPRDRADLPEPTGAVEVAIE